MIQSLLLSVFVFVIKSKPIRGKDLRMGRFLFYLQAFLIIFYRATVAEVQWIIYLWEGWRSIPTSSCPHVEVSLDKTLNPNPDGKQILFIYFFGQAVKMCHYF